MSAQAHKVHEASQRLALYDIIRDELAQVNASLRRVSDVEYPYLGQLLGHILETGGKRVRPAITLLASKFHPNDGKQATLMATAVELLHIATLVHDDTVDNAAVRRGKPTISTMWGREAAVLLGDYAFAKSATVVCDTGNLRVIKLFAETIMLLASGELTEMFTAYDPAQTRQQYSDRIFRKTASLFTTAAETGAILSGAPEPVVQSLKAYGYNIGMAFQIVDDILDYQGTADEVGKPVCSDLLHGVLTLPAILLMERFPEDNPIPKVMMNRQADEHLKRALDMIQSSSVLQDSMAVAQDYGRKSIDALSALPATVYRQSLQEIATYALERRR